MIPPSSSHRLRSSNTYNLGQRLSEKSPPPLTPLSSKITSESAFWLFGSASLLPGQSAPLAALTLSLSPLPSLFEGPSATVKHRRGRDSLSLFLSAAVSSQGGSLKGSERSVGGITAPRFLKVGTFMCLMSVSVLSRSSPHVWIINYLVNIRLAWKEPRGLRRDLNWII